MSKRDTLLLLYDMLQAAKKVKRYTSGLDYESFISDDKTKDAVVRNVEIITAWIQIFEMKIQKLNGKGYVDLEIELFMNISALIMK